MIHLDHGDLRIMEGDCLQVLESVEDESMQMCVTSPPYYSIRDYGHEYQLGKEETPWDYVDSLVSVFAEVRRVLCEDGTLWLNLGDSYPNASGAPGSLKQNTNPGAGRNPKSYASMGVKPKNLMGIPWRVAFALQDDGWNLRQEIIWHKTNPFPESVTDRPTRAHEQIFLFSKSRKYYYDQESVRLPFTDSTWIREKNKMVGTSPKDGYVKAGGINHQQGWAHDRKGANLRSVWEVQSGCNYQAHYASYPEELIIPCVKAGSREGDWVLDPFFGSGTTGSVCRRLGRKCLGIELNPEYCVMAADRLKQPPLPLFD